MLYNLPPESGNHVVESTQHGQHAGADSHCGTGDAAVGEAAVARA